MIPHTGAGWFTTVSLFTSWLAQCAVCSWCVITTPFLYVWNVWQAYLPGLQGLSSLSRVQNMFTLKKMWGNSWNLGMILLVWPGHSKHVHIKKMWGDSWNLVISSWSHPFHSKTCKYIGYYTRPEQPLRWTNVSFVFIFIVIYCRVGKGEIGEILIFKPLFVRHVGPII